MFFITLISCNRHIYNKHSLISKMPKISTKDSNILLQTKVIGDWGIYVTISGGMSSSCNVCPQIIFNDNGSAKIIFPTLTGDEEQMKWQIKNNILEILFKRYKEEGQDIFEHIDSIISEIAWKEAPDDKIFALLKKDVSLIIDNFIKENRNMFDREGVNEFGIWKKPIDDSGILLGGRIDRIEFEGGNRVSVIDFKTGKSDKLSDKNLRSQEKDSSWPWGKYYRQLVFYKLLLDIDTRYSMGKASLMFIDSSINEETKTVTTSIPKEDGEMLILAIKEITEQIVTLDFWDKPYDEKICRFNEYVKILKAGKK